MSWLASLLYLAGNIALARRLRVGWLLTGAADVALAVLGAMIGEWGLMLGLVFVPVRVSGWMKWKVQIVNREPEASGLECVHCGGDLGPLCDVCWKELGAGA